MRLRLYVAGGTPRSSRAVENVRAFAEGAAGAGGYELEVVDLRSEPARAEDDRILATPTLIRLEPEPQRRIIGDLAGTDRLHDLLCPVRELE